MLQPVLVLSYAVHLHSSLMGKCFCNCNACSNRWEIVPTGSCKWCWPYVHCKLLGGIVTDKPNKKISCKWCWRCCLHYKLLSIVTDITWWICSVLSIDLTPISLTRGLGMRPNTDLGHVWLYPLVDTISTCTVYSAVFLEPSPSLLQP